MKKPYNKLLERQLRKHYQDKEIPDELNNLLKAISDSYDYFEQDRKLIERSMDLSSNELMEANLKIREEVTKQKFAEQKISEHEQLIKSISDNITEAFYRSTPDQGLIFVNQAFVKLFGYDSMDEILLTPTTSFYYDPSKREELTSILSKNNSYKSVEVLFTRKDGTSFWGLVSSVYHTDRNGNVYYDGAIVDISHQKHNEEELRKTNKQLKKINAELDRFVYSASHDLKAPLMSLLGLINVIEIELEKKKEIKPFLEMMEKSVKKLDNFISDIIHYSRNTRVGQNIEIIDFHDIINDVLDKINYLPNTKEIDFQVDIDNHIAFYSDVYRLKILFNNLITNAIKYHDIQKTNPFIKIQVKIHTKYVLFTIEDNGQGIPSKYQKKVFDMFFRANHRSNGSGLGLYIVKEMLAKLKGKVKVKSEFGKGTCFIVKIPNSKISKIQN